MGDHLPAALRAPSPGRPPPGVDREDDALAAEAVGEVGQELRIGDRGGVDRHLVRPGPEEEPGVLDRPHPAAHGERDEDPLGRPQDPVEVGVLIQGGGGDI